MDTLPTHSLLLLLLLLLLCTVGTIQGWSFGAPGPLSELPAPQPSDAGNPNNRTRKLSSSKCCTILTQLLLLLVLLLFQLLLSLLLLLLLLLLTLLNLILLNLILVRLILLILQHSLVPLLLSVSFSWPNSSFCSSFSSCAFSSFYNSPFCFSFSSTS